VRKKAKDTQTVQITRSEIKELVIDERFCRCQECGGVLFQPGVLLQKFPTVHLKNIHSRNLPIYFCANQDCGAEFRVDEKQ